MPHIPGHVITPPKSCGVLQMIDSQAKMYFYPNWSLQLEKHHKVGFLPMTMKAPGLSAAGIIGIQIYHFADYERVETEVEKFCHGLALELLPLPQNQNELARVKANHLPGLPHPDKEILQGILNYFDTPDYQRFYVKRTKSKENTALVSANTANAIKAINQIMIAPFYHVAVKKANKKKK